MLMTISKNVKINLGNYQNTDIAVELADEVEPHEDLTTVAAGLIERIDAIIETEFDKIKAKNPNVSGNASQFLG